MILAADESKRWAVVAEIVRRMAVGDVPEAFLTRQVIGMDYEALFANLLDDTLFRQQLLKQTYSPLEERLAQANLDENEEWAVLEELFRWPSLQEWIAPTVVLERLQSVFVAMHQAAGSYLLFVDHFHRLVGGEWDKYPIDAVPLLKPVLARDRIQLIGACTREQYYQYIKRDAAIQRRCQEICLPETC